MSHEWQGPLRPGEKPNMPLAENPAAEKPPKAENETAVEKELSPEVIEMIMEKVQDIDKEGTVIHGAKDIDKNKIKSILDKGILPPKEVKKIKEVRFLHSIFSKHENKHQDEISFSVVKINSKAIFTRAAIHFIEKKDYENVGKDPDGMGVILRDKFIYENLKRLSQNPRELMLDKSFGDEITFKGIIPKIAINAIICPKKFYNLVVDEADHYYQESKNIVCIYDTDGNLLWPKRMSYEEVKKFVAERDAKKQEKE